MIVYHSNGLLKLNTVAEYIEKPEKPRKTRRGLELYDKNPFIVDASENTLEGARRRAIKSKDGSKLMVTNEAGDVVGPAGFWQFQEVDKTQFVKLYVNGVKAFKELTSPGTIVFELLYLEIQKAIGRDRVYLSFGAIPEEVKLSQATFTRGMRELMDKKFIAPTASVGWYFVNPDYLWNGDRLAYVKEFRLKRDAASDQDWRERLEARGQQRLEIDDGAQNAL